MINIFTWLFGFVIGYIVGVVFMIMTKDDDFDF